MRIIGITGASGSGKSSIARALQHALALDGQSPQLSILPVDAYYRDLSFLTLNEREAVDFDDPSAIEFELLAEHLKALKRGKAIGCPRYDFATHSREIETEIIVPSPLLLVEGLLLGAWDEVLDHVDALIFVETPLDVCLDRRLRRDCEERGEHKRPSLSFGISERCRVSIVGPNKRAPLPTSLLAVNCQARRLRLRCGASSSSRSARAAYSHRRNAP